MKLRQLFFTVLFFVAHQATAQVPDWAWARGSHEPAGCSGNTLTWSIAVDNFGNEYVTGYFDTSCVIVGADTFFNECGGAEDGFLVKYDAAGNVLWAKGLAGTNDAAFASSVKTDLAGNVFLVGAFEHGTAIFGPDTLRNDSLRSDVFIAKLDPLGHALWARQAANTNYSYASSVATDPFGNAYVTGRFYNPAITFGSYTLVNDSPGYPGIFIVKYDAAGNVIWARSPPYGVCGDMSIATSGSSVYVTGTFTSGRIIFGTDTLYNDSLGTGDICVAKYDSSGTVIWAKKVGGKQYDFAHALTTAGSEYLYVTGAFTSDSVRFGAFTLTADTSGGIQGTMFLAKYSAPSGNVVWAVKPNSSACSGAGVAADPAGNAYVTGHFNSANVIFGTDTLFNPGSFVAKYDASGNAVLAKGGGYFRAASNSIALDPSNSIYLTGYYIGISILVLGADTLHGTALGANDMFIAKLSIPPTTKAINNASPEHNNMVVYPVPNDGIMNVACIGSGYTVINIYDGSGRKIFSQALDPAVKDPVTKLNLDNIAKGIYLLQAIGSQGAVSKQILIR